MLVLTRREGETLVIDGDIKVTVLSIKGNQVRVGIDAPSEVLIHRQELLNAEEDQKQKSVLDLEAASDSSGSV